MAAAALAFAFARRGVGRDPQAAALAYGTDAA